MPGEYLTFRSHGHTKQVSSVLHNHIRLAHNNSHCGRHRGSSIFHSPRNESCSPTCSKEEVAVRMVVLGCFSKDTLKTNKKPNPVRYGGGPRENISIRRGRSDKSRGSPKALEVRKKLTC